RVAPRIHTLDTATAPPLRMPGMGTPAPTRTRATPCRSTRRLRPPLASTTHMGATATTRRWASTTRTLRPPATRVTDMLGRLIEWSARNVFLVLVMALALVSAGIYALVHTPLDAQPDLSDVQVIVFTEYPGQAPQVVEDQVTYPLTSALLAVANSKDVRGFSFFGASF